MSKFTPKQQQVIDFNEGNMVVTASAGSGKTSVMIERIIRLLRERRAEIDEILAVTFTKLAANEMKERISDALKKEIAGGGDRDFFKRQIEGLSVAAISTVHAFCANLLRTYFYAVELDPQFKILDDGDAGELRNRAIDEVFEKLYDEDDPSIKTLIEIFISHRSDKVLKELILRIYNFAISEKDIDEFFSKSLENYTEKGFKNADNRLMRAYVDELKNLADSIQQLSQKAAENDEEQLLKFFSTYNSVLGDVISVRTPSKLAVELSSINLRRPAIKKKTPIAEELIEEFENFKKQLNKLTDKINAAFSEDADARLHDTLSARIIVESLIFVVKLFIEKYDELKREGGVLDYNDLEHLTLKLLQNDELREEIKSRYKFIFIDEYQDTNGVQEAIFSQLSNKNLFIVGDVKQSIYSFRGCNPLIFKNKVDDCEFGFGTHIDLGCNFRSSDAVLQATNNVFSAVMFENYGGVNYADAPMASGGLYGTYKGAANYYIIEKEAKDDDKSLPKGVYSVKKHLAQMKSLPTGGEEKLICDIVEKEYGVVGKEHEKIFDIKQNQERNVTFGDITILTRNNKGLGDRIVAELVKRGIPVVSQSKRSIGEYPEIKLMIDLVSHIVNPTRDIPLASVLRSDIGGFSDNELSEIRAFSKDGNFYDACRKFAAEASGELQKRLNEFFDYFAKIRLIAQFDTAYRVLKKVVTETGFELKLLSSKLGKIKQSRVDRFILAGEDLTIYELFSKLDTLLENMTISERGGDDAVKIMSYHASKGLEFPIVILADVSKKFNQQDIKEEVLLDREFGIGIKCYDTEEMRTNSTAVCELIKMKKKRELSADEMRLFYVAMTRAKCRLHLVVREQLSRSHRYENFAFAGKMSDFLCEKDLTLDCGYLDFSREALERRPVILGESNPILTEKIKEFLDFSYQHQADTTLNLKRTVTQVAAQHAQSVEDDGTVFEEKPLFENDVAFVGTAYHRFLETCDFSKDAKSQLNSLFEEGKLSREQLDALDENKLNDILKLEIFDSIRSSNLKLYREQPFILNVRPQLVDQDGEEDVLLQGVIDLLAVDENNVAYIVDYKYSSKGDEALIATYQKQLELYANAVQQIIGSKIGGKYIVNIKSCRMIKLK